MGSSCKYASLHGRSPGALKRTSDPAGVKRAQIKSHTGPQPSSAAPITNARTGWTDQGPNNHDGMTPIPGSNQGSKSRGSPSSRPLNSSSSCGTQIPFVCQEHQQLQAELCVTTEDGQPLLHNVEPRRHRICESPAAGRASSGSVRPAPALANFNLPGP
jgi:hypothetical protein